MSKTIKYKVETKRGLEFLTVTELKKRYYEPIADAGGSKILGIIHDIDDKVVFATKDLSNDKIHLHIVKLNYSDDKTTFRAGGVTYNMDNFFRC